jgi:hypothetical protein
VASGDAKRDALTAEGYNAKRVERAASKLKVKVDGEGFPRKTFWSLAVKTQSGHQPPEDVATVPTVGTEATNAA